MGIEGAVSAVKPAMRNAALAVLGRVPALGDLLRERELLRAEVRRLRTLEEDAAKVWGFAPPGHFYSAIPSLAQVREQEQRLFGPPPRTVPGIDLREEHQLALLEALLPYYAEVPFPERPTRQFRYHFENPAYSWSDAIFLHCMLRSLRPRRIVEVGSGYSSCAILDTRERYLDEGVECTFIEPHPELLRSLLRPGDEAGIRVLPQEVQTVSLEVFAALRAGDVLFVDSTHVSKVGSDVNHLFFEVLTRLAPGVHVHFHDVFYPFEYPREWILEGRSWNEDYLLRAFLTFNRGWEIVLFNTFLEHFHSEWFERHMPLCLRNPGGSIWMRRAG
jgi:hypothetical protein